jgi:ParB family chromosome partitioning protein
MARKDIFANITSADNTRTDRKTTPGYATRGASRSMISSLGELAEKAAKAEQILQGEAVIELDPNLLDDSFVSDRLEHDEASFLELVEAMRERGQDSPVLVRPHPSIENRFQVVFGHRRVKAAKLLERPVRAVVKNVADVDHVIAQGQENSARENLSFIERAVFSQNLLDLGYERTTIQQALSVDAPMLTRMLSVTSRVSALMSSAIGSAKSVGRDRWLELAQLIERPDNRLRAEALIATDDFNEATSDGRFDLVMSELKKTTRAPKKQASASVWEPADKAVKAEFKSTGKTFALSLKAKHAGKFGKFLSTNLDRLYEEFQRTENSQGD